MKWSEYSPAGSPATMGLERIKVKEILNVPIRFVEVELISSRGFSALDCVVFLNESELGEDSEPYALRIFQSVLIGQLTAYFAEHNEPLDAIIVRKVSKDLGREYYTLE